MDETSQKIGIWLKNTRQSKNLTLPQLAHLAGLSHASLSRIENGASAVTLFTLVRIFYAFNYYFTALYDDLGLPNLNLPPISDKARESLDDYPSLTITDIEDFVALHAKKPAAASQIIEKMLDVKSVDLLNLEGLLPQENLRQIFQQYVNWEYTEYPPITLDTYRNIYWSGGVMTMTDLGNYIKGCRVDQGLSLNKLGKDVNLTHGGLSKFEKDISEKVKFVDLLNLDQALSLGGELLAIAWRVADLYTGVMRIKSLRLRGIEPPVAWTDEQIKWIERLLLVSRSYQHYLPGDRKWLKDFRTQV